GSRETGASSGGRNPAEQHPIPIHPLGAPWPPRSIQGKMLIAISESRRPRRNSVRYPVNAGSRLLTEMGYDTRATCSRLPGSFGLELTCTETFYPTRCRPLRLIHTIFLCNFRMKPEPPEIAQVRRNLTNLRVPGATS